MESRDGDGLKPVKTVVKATSLPATLLLPRALWAELFTLSALPAYVTVPSCSQPEAQAVGHPHCSHSGLSPLGSWTPHSGPHALPSQERPLSRATPGTSGPGCLLSCQPGQEPPCRRAQSSLLVSVRSTLPSCHLARRLHSRVSWTHPRMQEIGARRKGRQRGPVRTLWSEARRSAWWGKWFLQLWRSGVPSH